jgi:hypothetical protein
LFFGVIIAPEETTVIFSAVDVVTGQADDHSIELFLSQGEPKILQIAVEFSWRDVHRMDVGCLVARFAQGDRVIRQKESPIDTFTGYFQMTVRAVDIVGVFDGPGNVGPVFKPHGEVKINDPGSFRGKREQERCSQRAEQCKR